MPGTVCSVAVCKSSHKKSKELGEKIAFFRFPNDRKLRKEWVSRCYRKDKFDPTNKRICHKHFMEDDFEDKVEARLMNRPAKRLKKDAIPSLHLRKSEEVVLPTPRVERAYKKEQKLIVEELLNTTDIGKNKESEEPIVPIPSTSRGSDAYDELFRKYNVLVEENAKLKSRIEENTTTTNVLQNKVLELETMLKQQNVAFEEHAKNVFGNFLTPNQIDIALKKKTKARWTPDETSKAFTIRYFSKRCYVYLRENLKYPLPGLSTLQGWAANLKLKSGILPDVLNIMDVSGKSKNELERVTVLSFDEVKVCSTYEYDQKEDEVIGPHSYMQVIMARGLFDNWKQPVFIDFDRKMTKELLNDVITSLHNIKYNVVACISDCGGGNQGLWKELDITSEKTFCLHPVSQDEIYFFADVPHLLKLIRNWLLDTGFILENGKFITKNPLDSLIKSTDTEISSCHKLGEQHINCKKAQRQNVTLAAQVFSNTTATALKRYCPGDDKQLAKDVGDFVELVNNWYDVMNSYTPVAKVPTKEPYGKKLTMQDLILNEAISTFRGMRCINKQSLQIFQKGVILSSISLQKLFIKLKAKYSISYILTHRLNQDCLENFFSQIRSRGGLYDHPSPLALYRIRMILLGKNPGIVQTHTNIQQHPNSADEQYILAGAFKRAKIYNVNLIEPEQTVEDFPSDAQGSTSSSSVSTTSASGSITRQTEKDGLKYIAGYLAKKHQQEYPNLGEYTYKTKAKTQAGIHSYSMPSWVQSLSFGGLTEPSDEWMNNVFKLDKRFNKLHQKKFNFKTKIVQRTCAYLLKANRDVPAKLVKSFTRQRIFMRMKYLINLKKKADEEKKHCNIQKRKRELDMDDKERKSYKKMKKTIQ